MQSPTRDEMVTFMRDGIKMMRSAEVREALRTADVTVRPGERLIRLQRAGWTDLGVDADRGCEQLSASDLGDEELFRLRLSYVHTAMRTYLQALRDRRPAVAETSAPMPAAVVEEFFNACNTLMELPETADELLAELRTHPDRGSARIREMQTEMLETLGWEREHGLRCVDQTVSSSERPEPEPGAVRSPDLRRLQQVWQQKAQQALALVRRRAEPRPAPAEPSRLAPEEAALLCGKAKQEVEKMSPLERGRLLVSLKDEMKVLCAMPDAERQRALKQMSEDKRLQVMKAQVVMTCLTLQQGTKAGGAPACEQQHRTLEAPAQHEMK